MHKCGIFFLFAYFDSFTFEFIEKKSRKQKKLSIFLNAAAAAMALDSKSTQNRFCDAVHGICNFICATAQKSTFDKLLLFVVCNAITIQMADSGFQPKTNYQFVFIRIEWEWVTRNPASDQKIFRWIMNIGIGWAARGKEEEPLDPRYTHDLSQLIQSRIHVQTTWNYNF